MGELRFLGEEKPVSFIQDKGPWMLLAAIIAFYIGFRTGKKMKSISLLISGMFDKKKKRK